MQSFGDAQFPGDDGGCARVIARDHQRTNPGESRSRYRLPGFRPWRVDHADQPNEYQVLFDAVVRMIGQRCERIDR